MTDLDKKVEKLFQTAPKATSSSVLAPLDALALVASSQSLARVATGTWMGKIGIEGQPDQQEIVVVLTKRDRPSIDNIVEQVAVVERSIGKVGCVRDRSKPVEIKNAEVGKALNFLHANVLRSFRGGRYHRPSALVIRWVISQATT